ncbi:MAG: hypothetical protein LR015_14355 [Verrucomicrobia bacterium]|nr:hypothetical protein [Verrucomicrobiota bacterium]
MNLNFGSSGIEITLVVEPDTDNFGELLGSGYAAWLAELPTIAALFNLADLNLPILPDVLDDMFGIADLLGGLSIPDLSAF